MYLTEFRKRPSVESGYQPSLAIVDSDPIIVYVLPEPVCPYAKIVAAYPSSAESISSLTPHFENNSICVVF